ncbi:MAG: hypothetical protein AB7U41_03970 [Dongiaceae bacterium]
MGKAATPAKGLEILDQDEVSQEDMAGVLREGNKSLLASIYAKFEGITPLIMRELENCILQNTSKNGVSMSDMDVYCELLAHLEYREEFFATIKKVSGQLAKNKRFQHYGALLGALTEDMNCSYIDREPLTKLFDPVDVGEVIKGLLSVQNVDTILMLQTFCIASLNYNDIFAGQITRGQLDSAISFCRATIRAGTSNPDELENAIEDFQTMRDTIPATASKKAAKSLQQARPDRGKQR